MYHSISIRQSMIWGRTLFCFVTSDGMESPTLHVNPATRSTSISPTWFRARRSVQSETVSNIKTVCGDSTMTLTSANMHFHGLNVSPKMP